MVSYVVDIAPSVTHLGKVIRGHFDLVLGILNFSFKYRPDRNEQKQLRDTQKAKKPILFTYGIPRALLSNKIVFLHFCKQSII